jgi:hypothetical protein
MAVTVALAGCGGSGRELVEQVRAMPKRSSTVSCLFLVRAPLVNGGSQRTCITRVDGVPAPGATIHSRAVMTFVLVAGAIRTRVLIAQRFTADGVHARQTLRGTIVGGTGVYRRAHGTITGGGPVVDRSSGLGAVDLRYTLSLS